MAYAINYKITQASQSGDIHVVDLLSDGYAGSVINYEATNIQLEYIPASDDPFEPIYASQMTIGINVTDNAANMPDFTELDDRKYWVKYYKNGVLKWQGWALSDNVQYLFSTGFKELIFNAICGLGMLERIDYSTTNPDYRAIIWQFVFDCLRPIEFPTQPTILSQLSIYSSTMFNINDAPDQNPWSQAYMAINNFIQLETDTQGVTRNKYNCLQVLRDILISWGCRVFMANGEWNIVQVNQQANATRYWIRYQFTGLSLVNTGTFTTNVNVPNDLIFFDNSQLKIYKKGFNNFESYKQITFPDNFLQNANLKALTAGAADYWTVTTNGTGLVAIKENQDKGVNAFILALGNIITGSLAQVDSTTPMPISIGDSPKIQFRIYNTEANFGSGSDRLPNCILKLVISTTAVTYYLKDNNQWGALLPGTTDFYKVGWKPNNTLVNLEEIPPAPDSGTLTFGLFIGGAADTQPAIIIGDFEVSFESEYKSVLMTAEINATETYRKTITFPHGYNVDNTAANVKIGFQGAITDSSGNQMYGWYMFERLGIDNYFSLAELMFQNYINMYRQNIINIDASVYGTFEAADVLTFTDTDPSQISVQGNKYLIGNGTFNSQRNEFSGTFLQIDNTHQDITINTVYDNGVGVGISQSLSNNAATTSGAACAFTTYPQTKYTVQFLPVVGDFVYNDVNLTLPFAGNGLWWKMYIIYFNTTRSFRINAFGQILEVSTC